MKITNIAKLFWSHFCNAERGTILTEKGCVCNWCGKAENDEE